MEPKLRKLMDYQWRFDIRHRGRRLVPGGYIPMHYVDECYVLDGDMPTYPTLWCDGARGDVEDGVGPHFILQEGRTCLL